MHNERSFFSDDGNADYPKFNKLLKNTIKKVSKKLGKYYNEESLVEDFFSVPKDNKYNNRIKFPVERKNKNISQHTESTYNNYNEPLDKNILTEYNYIDISSFLIKLNNNEETIKNKVMEINDIKDKFSIEVQPIDTTEKTFTSEISLSNKNTKDNNIKINEINNKNNKLKK